MVAIDRNAHESAALVMGRDTSFLGTDDEVVPEDEVISAIKSVPTHY